MFIILLYLLIVSLLLQYLLFIPAFLFKTDKLTDLSYSLSFVLLSLLTIYFNKLSIVKLILFLMILFWALRLGGFLLYRVLKLGKDVRFDNIRNSFSKFFVFWTLQGISVFIILLNSFFIFLNPESKFKFFSIIGMLIWLIGFIIEGISDIQKFKFKQKNKDVWINEGFWKYSRHPNYFGEMLCWIGIFVYSFFYLNTMYVVYSLISPLFIMFLLLFVSGIPTLEKKYDDKFKDNPDYLRYKQKTNLLFPIKLKK